MSTDCTADIEQHYRRTGEFIMKDSLPVVWQTVFWSGRGSLGHETALLALIGMMFVVDTVMFSLDLYTFFYQTQEIFLSGIFEGDGLNSVISRVDSANAAFSILNLVSCGQDPKSSWSFLSSSYSDGLHRIVNFPIFVACNIKHRDDDAFGGFGPTACLATSASALVMSFCANISATLMIIYTAWSYYTSQKNLQTSTSPLRRRSQVARVLLLLVESGLAYFLLMLLVQDVLSTILTPHCAHGTNHCEMFIAEFNTIQAREQAEKPNCIIQHAFLNLNDAKIGTIVPA
ncbi:hypothetical protein C8J56DRAFT_1139957 [Mycena floridula]|nr:hypothetical protein C8J56DRAFT_1139957 [Mycena floridula]